MITYVLRNVIANRYSPIRLDVRHDRTSPVINRYRKLAGLLLFCGLIFLFTSCDRADLGGNTVDPEPELPTGEMVTLSFTVSDIGFVANEVVTHAASKTSPNPSLGGAFSSLLGGDRGGSVSLRADTVPLAQDVIVRIVVYAGSPLYDTYYGYADYRMDGGLLTPYPAGSPEMSVPAGNYRFVAYSVNSDNPSLMPAFSPTTVITGSLDLLWGKEDNVNITPVVPTVHITMQRKMAKVVIHATAENLFSLNSIDTEIYGYQPVLTVQNGILSPGGSLVGMPFVWNIANPALLSQTSDTLYVFTDEAPVTALKINSMSINGIAYTDPRYASYTKPLEAGKSYTIHVNFTRAPSGGSTSRITWEPASVAYTDGRYVITNDPRNAGLHFKFGSVVGIYTDVDPGSNTGRILTLPGQSTDPYFNTSRDIAWHPQPFLNPISSWTDIPVYMSGDLPNKVTPQDNYHTTANVMAGKGDPCRLVGLDLAEIKKAADSGGSLLYANIDNGQWRLPTVQENMDFTGYNSANPGDWWWAEGQLGNISFGVAGAEFPARNQGGASRFLPAAGLRDSYNNSELLYTGYFGFYWTNEPFSGPNGYSMFFYQTSSNPTQLADVNNGYSVRCVGQSIEFEIEVNDWIPGGTLGMGGEGDVIVF